MELAVYNLEGSKTAKKIKLDKKVFGIEPNDHAIYLDVKQILANKRQGTHKTKERGEVAGSTKKIKRQKGTGTARFGDIKNPIFRGGGRTFGPRPRNYGFKLNKKLKRLARLSALSYKMKEEGITVVENFEFAEAKTKKMVEVLNGFKLQDQKVLFVVENNDKNLYLSLRNLRKVNVARASDINTYDILNANRVLMTEGSVETIQKIHSVN